MSFSNYLENELLDHVFGRDAGYTQPGTLYVALSSTDLTEDGSGLTEPSSNGYARTSVPNWDRTGNEISNQADIIFPTATGPWLGGANLGFFGVYDAAAGGNLLAYGSFSPAQAVIADNTMIFRAGELKVTLD